MIKRLAASLLIVLFVGVAGPAQAAGGAALEHSGINLKDTASLQRGAALFMNFCAGCHGLQYQRYSRLAEDLGLSEAQTMAKLNFTGAAFGETIETAMVPGDGEAWFGKAPPDLSLVARNKPGGPDWTYTFLKSFYVDETRPAGWNNTVLANASMPNVLWSLQGIQRAVYAEGGPGGLSRVERLELTEPGRLDPEQYDRAVRDITAFLAYVGEPAVLKREAIGVWVLLFLALFTLMAWLLKQEYWRDVH